MADTTMMFGAVPLNGIEQILVHAGRRNPAVMQQASVISLALPRLIAPQLHQQLRRDQAHTTGMKIIILPDQINRVREHQHQFVQGDM